MRTRPSYHDQVEVQKAVFEAFKSLALPSDFICPGNRVVLKPNWVKEYDERHPGPNSWEHVITHPSVIEAVVNWVAEKLQNSGRIIICDAPQTDSSFAMLRSYCGLDEMLAKCRHQNPGLSIELLDLRPEEWNAMDGVTVSKTTLPGDPLGATHIRLNESSEFYQFHGEGRLYGASYDMAETNSRHKGNTHEYLLCRTPLEADVFINLPKLKTHKKVGLTCALKNFVGINANKNWLPHHTEGTPESGGDQFPLPTSKAKWEHSLMGLAKRWLKNRPVLARGFVPLKKLGRLYFGDTAKVVRSGNWHGNDTCWRMVLDLNKCFFFFDGGGQRRTQPPRYLALVDGIIAGEGNGPMSPDAKPCGLILAGIHPVAIDCVAATLMGFDFRKIKMLLNCFQIQQLDFVGFRPEEITVWSNHEQWKGDLSSMSDLFSFRPHFGWVRAIEKVAPLLRP